MTMRGRLTKLASLLRLQEAERTIAALDHAAACVEAADRHADAAQARGAAGDLADHWYAGRALGRFAPEVDAAVAAGLLVAERRSAAAAGEARAADDRRDERGAAWRLADARQQATGRIVRDARRDLARAADEARLDAAAARALDRWRRG